MTTVELFITGIAVTTLISLVLVLYLRTSLKRLLVDLCGTDIRGAFWASFVNVLLVLAPIMGSMLIRPGDEAGVPAFFKVVDQVKWGLFSLVFTLAIIGAAIRGRI